MVENGVQMSQLAYIRLLSDYQRIIHADQFFYLKTLMLTL